METAFIKTKPKLQFGFNWSRDTEEGAVPTLLNVLTLIIDY